MRFFSVQPASSFSQQKAAIAGAKFHANFSVKGAQISPDSFLPEGSWPWLRPPQPVGILFTEWKSRRPHRDRFLGVEPLFFVRLSAEKISSAEMFSFGGRATAAVAAAKGLAEDAAAFAVPQSRFLFPDLFCARKRWRERFLKGRRKSSCPRGYSSARLPPGFRVVSEFGIVVSLCF
jgi:hypothetical protein